MKHIKLFENFDDSLFHKIDDPRQELSKRGTPLPIIQHANTIRDIFTETIGDEFKSKPIKDLIGSYFFIQSDKFEFKIRRLDDEYYLVSYWPNFIGVEHYIADDLDGLEQCLVYLLQKPIHNTFINYDDYDDDYDDDEDPDNFDY